MKQGINLSYVLLKRNSEERRTLEQGLALCRQAGFLELDYLTPLRGDDYLEQADRARAQIDAAGMAVHQSHCPFLRYEPGGLAIYPELASRAAKAAARLGATYFVIHADEWPSYEELRSGFDFSQALQKNYEIMAPLVEECFQLGLVPAFENLFEGKPDVRDRYTGRWEDLDALFDKFNDPRIRMCLDTGHAYVSQKGRIVDFVRHFAPRVACTHIHGNKNGNEDAHLPICMENTPFEDIMKALREGGYSGVFTWEMVYGRYPEPLLPKFLELLHATGDYFISL